MFIEPTIISLLVGKIRKGKIRNLEYIEIRGWYLLIMAALIQIGLSLLKRFDFSFGKIIFDNYFIYLHGLSYVLMMICMMLNIRKNSMKIFLIGIILNFMVIFANGGQMPVSLNGIRGINEYVELPLGDFDIKHQAVTPNTKLVYLSDIILIPRPYPLPKILSIGDVFLMMGLFLFLQEAMVGDTRNTNPNFYDY